MTGDELARTGEPPDGRDAAARADASRARRVVLGALALVAALALLSTIVGALVGGPSGPPASSYATSPRGFAAWAELLERDGRRVGRVLEHPDEVRLDPNAAVVLVEPDALVASEARALRDFVERGGLLIAGGPASDAWLGEVVDDPPAWSDAAPTRWRVEPDAGLGGARRVRSIGAGAWEATADDEPLVTAGGGLALAVRRRLGDGSAVLLADASPLENRLLASDDDAALALALTRGRERVLFLEAAHGYGRGRGLGALPVRWRVALGGLALAALLLVASRARRVGPPDPEPVPPLPARREHVDALGAALARTREREWAAARLRDADREAERRRSART